jgi:WD40 repeat protein
MIKILALLAVMILIVVNPQTSGKISSSGLLQIEAMHETRASHTATILRDGNVLIAGGFKKGPDGYSQVYTRTAELFDPKRQRFTYTGNMTMNRSGHVAASLPDGRVLLAGGYNEDGKLASADIYDPSTGSFTSAGNMTVARGGMAATLLKNGRVLIVGGSGDEQKSAELFDPTTGRFTATGNLNTNRFEHTATLLPDGKVLIAGGGERSTVFASSELYDPETGNFSLIENMNVPRRKHAAVLLADGNVLIVGGSDSRDWRGQYNTAEIYDSRKGRFSGTITMQSQRFKLPNAVVLLPKGTVLIAGGSKDLESFNQHTRQSEVIGQLTEAFFFSTATLLGNGSVLIVGGYNRNIQATAKAWVYRM